MMVRAKRDEICEIVAPTVRERLHIVNFDPFVRAADFTVVGLVLTAPLIPQVHRMTKNAVALKSLWIDPQVFGRHRRVYFFRA